MKYGSGATVDSVLWGLAACTNGGTCGCAQWPGAVALALDRVQPSARASVCSGCAQQLLSVDWGQQLFLRGAVHGSAGCCVARTL